MDKAYKYAKSAIANFKLDTCCCFVPIRNGLLVVGYFNLLVAFVCLIGTATGGPFTGPLMEIQESLLGEENVSETIGIIAYATELGLSIVLLCAMYRNDIVLLQVYIYFVMATVVMSVLIYSMVIAAQPLFTEIVIIGNIVFNCYVMILVRSAIVEIKQRQSLEKNGHVILYSVATIPHDDDRKAIEIEPMETSATEMEPKVEVNDDDLKQDERTCVESHTGDQSNTGEDSNVGDESNTGDESKTGEELKSDPKGTHTEMETVNEHPKEQSVH